MNIPTLTSLTLTANVGNASRSLDAAQSPDSDGFGAAMARAAEPRPTRAAAPSRQESPAKASQPPKEKRTEESPAAEGRPALAKSVGDDSRKPNDPTADKAAEAGPDESSAVESTAPVERTIGAIGGEVPDPSSQFSAPTMTILGADAREAPSPTLAMAAQAAQSPLPAMTAPAAGAASPARKAGLPADGTTGSAQTDVDVATVGNARPAASSIAIAAASTSTPPAAQLPATAPAKDVLPTQGTAPLLAHPQRMDETAPRRPLASAIAQALRGPEAAASSTAPATSASEALAAPPRWGEWVGEFSSGREAAASAPRFDMTSASVSFATVLGSTPGSSRAAALTIATPLGQAEFASDVGQQIVMLASSRVRSAELALTPAELGPVRVSIEMRGQEATVVLAAAAAATRTALEEALPRLREMFAQQGLNLTDASVGAQLGQNSPHADGRSSANAAASRNDGIETAKEAESQSTLITVRRPVRLIDVTA